MNNTILNDQVGGHNGRRQAILYTINDEEIDDKIGEWNRQDAITDHTWDIFLQEIGKITNADLSGVTFDDPSTWRDLEVEKAVKSAFLTRSGLKNRAEGQRYGKLLTDVYKEGNLFN